MAESKKILHAHPTHPGSTREPVRQARVAIISLVLGLLCLAVPVRALEWSCCLDARQDSGIVHLCFGVHPDATAGLDPGLEVEFPPPPPLGPLHAVFAGPGLGNGVRVDLRSSAESASHELSLRLYWGSSREPVIISWNSSHVAEVTTQARLRDAYDGALGIDVDMATVDSLVLTDPNITSLSLVFSSVGLPSRRLEFATQPAGAVSGQLLATQPVVVVIDTTGRVVRDFSGVINLDMRTLGCRLSGSASVRAEQGVARFSDLAVSVPTDGEAVSLRASDDAGHSQARPVASATMIVDVVATQLAFRVLPEGVQDGLLSPAPVIAAIDDRGAVDMDFQERVELSIEIANATLGEPLASVAQEGVATFPLSELNPGIGRLRIGLVAETAGLQPVRSDSIRIHATWRNLVPTDQAFEIPDPQSAPPGLWLSLGPPAGGAIPDLARGGQFGGTLYAGTGGAGVYRSTDRGESWRPMDSGLVDAVVHGVAAAEHSQWAYAATDSGVYRSSDVGRSWTCVLPVPAVGVLIHPRRADIVFALAEGLRWSQDAGYTWEAIDPARGGTALATDSTGRIVITDRAVYAVAAGTVGFVQETGLPAGVRCLAVDPRDPQAVYAGTSDFLYVSDDGAHTWSAKATTHDSGQSLGALAVAPHPSGLYVGNDHGIYVSGDRGESWTMAAEFSNAPTHPRGVTEAAAQHSVLSLAFDRFGLLLAGTADGGVFRQIGITGRWEASNNGLGNVDVGAIVADPLSPGVIYATGAGRVYKRSRSGSWQTVLHTRGGDDTVWGIAVNPADPEMLITEGETQLRISRDGGEIWEYRSQDNPSLFPLTFSPTDPNVLYAGISDRSNSVAVSMDRGLTWHWSPVTAPEVTIGEREETEFYARQLVVSPDGSTIYLSTSRGLFQAPAQDLTWTAVSGGLPAEADILALALHPESPAMVLAGTAAGQLWQSADHGHTWAQLAPIASGVRAISSIVIVPDPSGGIYVATAGDGVFASEDAGRSWLPKNRGLLSKSVRALALDADSRHLYAGTRRTGVFIMTLDRPADGNDSGVDTSVTPESDASRSQLRIDRAFPNPFNATAHVQFLTDADGPVTLTVFNAAGQRIRTLVDAHLDAGNHAISWDGSDASGRPAGSGTYFLSLRARSGEHTAKLQLVRCK